MRMKGFGANLVHGFGEQCVGIKSVLNHRRKAAVLGHDTLHIAARSDPFVVAD